MICGRHHLEAIDDDLHVGHGGGEQGAHADDVGLEGLGRGGEFLDALVHADVLDLEPGALGHHADEVLADVVEIAADGAHEQATGGIGVALGAEERLEDEHPGFHGTGADEHLGHVENVVLEVLADDTHAGDEAPARAPP